MESEPFFPNLMAIFCRFNKYITQETSFFPNSLEGEYRFGDITSRTANKENMFLLRQNEGIQQKLDYFFEINGEQ
jgi:hypothetical protein